MSTIAFVGLGEMGSRMAQNLVAGHKLRVYNRGRAKTQPLAEQGVTQQSAITATDISRCPLRTLRRFVSSKLLTAE